MMTLYGRAAQRHLEYARQIAGPPRTEASLNSELDRPADQRRTTKDEGDPPVVLQRRALASLVVVLDELLGLVALAERWAPVLVLGALLLFGAVSLAVGASLGSALTVYQLQQEREDAVHR